VRAVSALATLPFALTSNDPAIKTVQAENGLSSCLIA
jgi:hypothetical protein